VVPSRSGSHPGARDPPHHEAGKRASCLERPRVLPTPKEAYLDQSLGEFLLPHEAVRKSSDPETTPTSFLESTYNAAADFGGWDREALECPMGEPLRPRPLNIRNSRTSGSSARAREHFHAPGLAPAYAYAWKSTCVGAPEPPSAPNITPRSPDGKVSPKHRL
jgi:hypothetical protein